MHLVFAGILATTPKLNAKLNECGSTNLALPNFGQHVQINGIQNTEHDGCPMSLKAAEASTLLKFALHELMSYGGAATFGEPLVGAGGSLVKLVDELKQHDIMPTPIGMSVIKESLRAHLLCCQAAGLRLTPKHHLLAHLVHRTWGHTQLGGRSNSLVALCWIGPDG